jgi:hypothetical protein
MGDVRNLFFQYGRCHGRCQELVMSISTSQVDQPVTSVLKYPNHPHHDAESMSHHEMTPLSLSCHFNVIFFRWNTLVLHEYINPMYVSVQYVRMMWCVCTTLVCVQKTPSLVFFPHLDGRPCPLVTVTPLGTTQPLSFLQDYYYYNRQHDR